MHKFLKIAFWFTSIVLIASSCSIRHHSTYQKVDTINSQNQDFIATQFQKVLFKTQIDAFGNSVSGLLFIKLINSNDYRFVFLTQLGMKIFDVELRNSEFKVHHLISYLDKKSVRRVLKNDLELLIRTPKLTNTTKYYKHRKDSSILLRERTSGRYYYYLYNMQNIISKENSGLIFSGTKISYTYLQQNNLPESIKIKHSGINLQWELRPVKQ